MTEAFKKGSAFNEVMKDAGSKEMGCLRLHLERKKGGKKRLTC